MNAKMNALLRGQRRDERGRFTHPHPHVAPLLRARAEAQAHGDYQFMGELEQKLRAIDPTLAPLVGIDAGAGRGQAGARDLNPNALMNAEIRGALIEKREHRRWLGGAYD